MGKTQDREGATVTQQRVKIKKKYWAPTWLSSVLNISKTSKTVDGTNRDHCKLSVDSCLSSQRDPNASHTPRLLCACTSRVCSKSRRVNGGESPWLTTWLLAWWSQSFLIQLPYGFIDAYIYVEVIRMACLLYYKLKVWMTDFFFKKKIEGASVRGYLCGSS